MKISRVVIDVIERDTGSLKVIDERSDIGFYGARARERYYY